jgi:hypothetical protein
MYRPGNDMRIGDGDSAAAIAAKQRMTGAFDAMKGVSVGPVALDIGDGRHREVTTDPELARLWNVVRDARAVLDRELHESVRAYEEKHRKP